MTIRYDRMEIYVRTEEKAKIAMLARKSQMSVSRFVIEKALGTEVKRD